VKLHRGRGNVVILGLKVVLRRMKRQTLRSNSGFLSEIGNATFTHSLDLGLDKYETLNNLRSRVKRVLAALGTGGCGLGILGWVVGVFGRSTRL